MKKFEILFTPSFGENQYLENQHRILTAIDYVSITVVDVINISTLFKYGFNSFDFVIVNWLENFLASKKGKITPYTLFQLVYKFLIIKLISKKIIYVRHNIFPHSLSGSFTLFAEVMTDLLVYFSDICVVHSGHLIKNKTHYLPHPLYKFDENLNNQLSNYYIVFGRIVEYKVIDKLLKFWGQENLIIAGKVENRSYLNNLKKIVSSRKLNNVKFSAKFLSNSESSNLVGSSKGLIITHSEVNVIVSGSFFFALSLGVPVYAIETPFFNWLVKNYQLPGLFIFKSISELVSAVENNQIIIPDREIILNSAISIFGDNAVCKKWQYILTEL